MRSTVIYAEDASVKGPNSSEPSGVSGTGPRGGVAHEKDLVSRIGREDRAALEELYRIYHRRLARFLNRLTRSYDVAEEIINDTFWVVWRKASEFRGDSQPSTWILGIAYRKARNAFRCSARMPVEEDVDALPPLLITEGPQRAEELRDWLGHALGQLPDEQRHAVVLCYELGFSCEEISSIMECPTNTVKTRLFHARAKLQRLLLASGDADSIPRPLARRAGRLKSATSTTPA
jgi:RNA polymerase sigma-70 factor (ECF subfamily)